jgi:cytochrome oxidase Cu insertion factor (SCO1/SenC/PrrC family)
MLGAVAGEIGAAEIGAAAGSRRPRTRAGRYAVVVAVVAAVGGVAVGVGVGVGLLSRAPAAPRTAAPIAAIATWGAGARPAPAFRLADQHGVPFTLRSLRGRPVIVTFIDPLCRSLCPLEARTLMQAVAAFPPAARPTIVSVSVNPWGNTAAAFRADTVHWRLGSGWRWGIADRSTLARVWRAYDIGVSFATRKVGGVAVHEVAHTEASYLVDAQGDERALFLYPFRATDVTAVLRRLTS